MNTRLMFVLFRVIIALNTFSTMNCFNVIYNNPEVPCGLRYNERSMEVNKPTMMGKMRILESKSLDQSSNLSYKTGGVIENQKRHLTKVLGELHQISAAFDQHMQHTFRTLVEYAEKLFGHHVRFQQAPHQKPNTRRNEPFDEDVDNEILDKFAQTRELIHEIENNLKIKTRIIGGTQASIKEFPWLVSIQVHKGAHICGGSIIRENWILTAAHCVTDPKTNGYADKQYVVGTGSSFWQKGKQHDVIKVVKHPGFTFEQFRNDVALMKVHPPIELKRGKVVPICLPPRNAEVFGAATIAGWGLTHNDNKDPSPSLMRVNVEILDDAFCASKYSNFDRSQMICAGRVQGGKDSCQGDSGGGLQCMLGDGRVYLMGAVSFGDRCGRSGYPGVYTKESSYIDWIYTQIAADAAMTMKPFMAKMVNQTNFD